jgi:hypothetical protein
LLSSIVAVPIQPGSKTAAVEWTVIPNRAIDERPSSRPKRSSGSSSLSTVEARAKSPGCIMNGSSVEHSIVRMASPIDCGWRGSMYE